MLAKKQNMRIRIIIIFGLLIAGALLSACGLPIRYTEVRGSGVLATILKPVTGINAVELNGIGNLIIQQGDKESLEITAEENLIKYIKSVSKGTSLHLYIEDYVNLRPTMNIIYRLTVKDLRRITADGIGQIEVMPLETAHLGLKLSGNNAVMVSDLVADSFTLDASGLGDVEINGAVNSQDISISGMGNYSAEALQSRKARVSISGAGSALLWATEELHADLSGAGSIQYYGSPVVSTDISGAGSVKSLGDK